MFKFSFLLYLIISSFLPVSKVFRFSKITGTSKPIFRATVLILFLLANLARFLAGDIKGSRESFRQAIKLFETLK